MLALLDHAIRLKAPVLPAPASAASFKRIIIQDGSVIRFHDSATKDFPADSGASGMKAMLRLQFAYDYKSGRTLIATPAAYSHTDTAAAGESLDLLEAGDLSIRDMGYYKAEWFAQMDAAGVFYLSRLQPEVKIPRETAGSEELRQLYGLRWHVELVFKALKGNGCLRALAAHASNRHHLEVLLLAQLLQLVLNLRLWRMLSPATKGAPRLSLLKMAALARETLAALWPEGPGMERWDKHMKVLLYRCRHDKRRNRQHLDEIWESGLG